MPNSGFRSLFADEVEALYAAESLISKAFSSLKKKVATKELVLMLDQQAAQAKSHTRDLKSALIFLDRKASRRENLSVKAMLAACDDALERLETGNLRDATLLVHLQRFEFHRLGAYKATLALATQLGEDGILDFLKDAAAFDDVTTKRLGQIAVQVNAEAFADTRSETLAPVIGELQADKVE
jgi:ferritin-like metal-binding protein YciE